jgi:hypothetical protein
MDGCAYNAYTNPILIKHQILPYPFLIKQAKLTVMHSIYDNYAPASFNDVWQKNSERNSEINLRNANNLYIPQPRTEAFKKSTMYSLPSIWNELSSFVKLQTNIIFFKWALNPNPHTLLFILNRYGKRGVCKRLTPSPSPYTRQPISHG